MFLDGMIKPMFFCMESASSNIYVSMTMRVQTGSITFENPHTHTHILILITQNRCWMISFSPECHGHGDIASSSSYVKTTKPHDIQILVPYTSEHEHVERNKFLILKMKSSEPSLLFWVQNANVPITPRKRIYPLKIDGSLLMFQKSSYNP